MTESYLFFRIAVVLVRSTSYLKSRCWQNGHWYNETTLWQGSQTKAIFKFIAGGTPCRIRQEESQTWKWKSNKKEEAMMEKWFIQTETKLIKTQKRTTERLCRQAEIPWTFVNRKVFGICLQKFSQCCSPSPCTGSEEKGHGHTHVECLLQLQRDQAFIIISCEVSILCIQVTVPYHSCQ